MGNFPNSDRKIKSCPLRLKIGTHGILEVLIPNPKLDFWNSDPKIHFWANFGSKIQICSFCLKIGAPSISRMVIPNPNLGFWNFDPKIHFWANLGPKGQIFLFCLNIGTHDISRMLILIPTLVFWISNPNFLFGEIWVKKVKVAQFGWKLAHRVSRQCWFLFRHYFFQFSTHDPFLDNLVPKNSKLFILTKNWHAWYIEDADSYSNLVFWITNPKSIFGQIWAEKVKIVQFDWKLAHTHIHTQYLEDVDSYFDISFLRFQT